MQPQSAHFKRRAAAELANAQLQSNMRRFGGRFVAARAKVIGELDDFEGTRTAAAAARDRALENLDVWIERFEREAKRRGASVLFAETGEEVARLVIELCRHHGVRKVTKSKSMLSEEASLNQRLEAAGVQAVETDLGEYILQLAGEPPSHIIAPAIHKSKEQVADLFERAHGRPRTLDIPQMTREAREVLRGHFLSADMGISGGNFLIAETGSVALVTNEGNGRMVTTLPRVHVCITGIEKVLPTLEDLALVMRLLPRSATGQSISNYFTVATGVRAPGDRDGPEHMYFILVDNGRTNLIGGDLHEMLRCIRCGACMNHCPVYQTIGGHAYGWVYPGPMGSVLTPSYLGLENALDLPHASTLCGECGVVCPVKIPLPELLRKLREKQVDRGLRPRSEVLAIRAWSWLAQRPRLYASVTRMAARYLRFLGGGRRRISRLPFGGAWTRGRDMPAPEGRTFRELYARRRVDSGK
ncbi:MAG: LutB/LldF family L-lactate oxidation iron-sulfur protein [Burkholderiales bacterium]|nr:LutB/LldF family L-lactate oxidation iron-sulfur protein [Burkholderiales bacterium]